MEQAQLDRAIARACPYCGSPTRPCRSWCAAATTVPIGEWVMQGQCGAFDDFDRLPLKEQKAICASCPVRRDCLGYALDAGIETDVWGGLNYRERARVSRNRMSVDEVLA